jgi:hypothetical protein
MIGWIGHAIEEYQAQRLIRLRARYVGSYPPLTASECMVARGHVKDVISTVEVPYINDGKKDGA